MDAINQKHDTNFNEVQIQYGVVKLCFEIKDRAHINTYDFVKMAQDDVLKNDGYFCSMKKKIMNLINVYMFLIQCFLI